jgi:hypothetical protein
MTMFSCYQHQVVTFFTFSPYDHIDLQCRREAQAPNQTISRERSRKYENPPPFHRPLTFLLIHREAIRMSVKKCCTAYMVCIAFTLSSSKTCVSNSSK